MKKSIFSFLLILVLLISNNCKKEEEFKINLNPSTQTVGNDDGFFLIIVNSPGGIWSASSNSSWCTLLKASGGDGDTIFGLYNRNSSSSSRTATITVEAVNSISATATIIQEGNIICEGKAGETAYLPLANNNQWMLASSMNPGSNFVEFTVSGTQNFNGKTYTKLVGRDLSGTFNIFLRKEANGDIMYYSQSRNQEYLYIPANPTLNQSWDFPAGFSGKGSRKVVSVSASVNTSKCSYTNCLQIRELDEDGSVLVTYSFKRGVGMVQYNVFFPYSLTSLKLY
jgi:hypothetical protein